MKDKQFHLNGFRFDREDANSDAQHWNCIVNSDEDGQCAAIGDKSG